MINTKLMKMSMSIRVIHMCGPIPNNVALWVDLIERELGQLDPANADIYASNAASVSNRTPSTRCLDSKNRLPWFQKRIAKLSPIILFLVILHLRYGFEQLGAINPWIQHIMPSHPPKRLAEMEDAIQVFAVKAIFVGNTVNPNLAERVAEDTGIKLVSVYTGSLSDR